ncbi:hypothetical protein BKA66DRAFT_430847 [Pyrenochaeta sp. MPI-SDFR-AT-0127]|nr:hypothetical protein BKA66DRAFT_430847 [Pyrenochaeta sp. MPI-SDFR-AT-0127]
MAALARNNAFGVDSPSWNLSFPAGNLTAAEILAYLPHWLKSVDVIDRFITNGARSVTVAAMINEFRHQPADGKFAPNSAQIMMSYAMRHAGYENWKVSTHGLWERESEMDEANLDVSQFRPPRLTHPKIVTTRNPHDLSRNHEAAPIPLKDLALHVKKHPSGNDALDLARCVQYALSNQDEIWLFPTDFERLVIHLGGPRLVTESHYDRQVFARREKANTRTKSTIRNEGLGRVLLGSQRRSRRLEGKRFNLREEESDITDFFDSVQPKPNKRHKRTHDRVATLSPSSGSDFVQDVSEPDEDAYKAENVSEEETPSPLLPRSGRAAAQKARLSIQSSFVGNQSPSVLKMQNLPPCSKNIMTMLRPEPKAFPDFTTKVIDPEIMQAATLFPTRQPVFLRPPVLSANRLRVDAASIHLYAADGCSNMQEMWDSALSSVRFGGPRRHPPFRELHRLTDPSSFDASDWAENIRWAKEQHVAFGSDTWTEYDYHLDLIAQARRETTWVSEEAIRAGI